MQPSGATQGLFTSPGEGASSKFFSHAPPSPATHTPNPRLPHHAALFLPTDSYAAYTGPADGAPLHPSHHAQGEALVDWSHERRARASCDEAVLHSPPVALHHCSSFGRTDGRHLSPSLGRGGGYSSGGRGQSMPASLWRHSGLLEGLGGSGSDGGGGGHRSLAPDRANTLAVAHHNNTNNYHTLYGDGGHGGLHTTAQDASRSPHGVAWRFQKSTSPRLPDGLCGRPTTLLSTGRGSDFWPTVRPTTFLPPSSSSMAEGGAPYVSGSLSSSARADWSGHSPESAPQPPHAPPHAAPLTAAHAYPPYVHAGWPGEGGGHGEEATIAYAGDSPCGPLDGCTQVWPTLGASPVSAPLYSEHAHGAAAHAGDKDDNALLRSPPRVAASGSLPLACSRPQSCTLMRSCSVNELPWRRSGLHDGGIVPLHGDVTMAAAPLFAGATTEADGPFVPPAPVQAQTLPLFCSHLPDGMAREETDVYGAPATASTMMMMCAPPENTNGALSEEALTQNIMDFAEIADLDHAPRKSYRHECVTGAEETVDSSVDVQPCRSAPPASVPESASCTSSAHVHATRRITDTYTTEDEDDEEVWRDPAHEAMLLPDPQQLAQWPQAPAQPGFGGGGSEGFYPSFWLPTGAEQEEEEDERAEAVQDDVNESQVRTVSRRQAMAQRLGGGVHGSAAPLLSQSDCGYISSVGVVDDTQISLDLGAQLSSLRVQASPTHKRLAFEEALDEDDPLTLRDPADGEPRLSTFGRLSGLDPAGSTAPHRSSSSYLTADLLNASDASFAPRFGSTNPSSPCFLSSTLAPDEQAPHISGVWAAHRQAGRRYTVRQGPADATRARTQARPVQSGLSLLQSRKRCLEEMAGGEMEDAALAGFFTVMVTADGQEVAPPLSDSDVVNASPHPSTTRVGVHGLRAHKKYRLDRPSPRPPTSSPPPPATLVLCDRSPNVLFGSSPSRLCHNEASLDAPPPPRVQLMANANVHHVQ